MPAALFFLFICMFTLQAQAAESEKPRLLFLDLSATLVEQEEVNILTRLVGAEMGRYTEYDVITSTDLQQMAALEAEKQSMGCANDSCLAELAGAMGARYVIFGNVGKLGKQIILTLNLFDSTEAKSVARGVLKVSDISEVPDKVPNILDQLLRPDAPETSGVQTAAVDKTQTAGTAPMPSETPAPELVVEKPAFPWLRVGSASALALVSAGVALGWGLPSYLDTADKEAIVDAGGDQVSQVAHNNMTAAQNAYKAGPMWGLMGGSILAAIAGGYGAYVALTFETEE